MNPLSSKEGKMIMLPQGEPTAKLLWPSPFKVTQEQNPCILDLETVST
jgi:hypothetical protein